MSHLPQLFRLMELTRAQTQYGYILAGIKKSDLSTLADHHYLVAFTAWQIARYVNNQGGKIDIEKVLALSLVHDLGELMGGDISMPYARKNPEARKHAKAFEEENQKFLAQYFGNDREYYLELCKEVMNAQTDEGFITKMADYIECTQYKLYVGAFTPEDIDLVQEKMNEMAALMKDEKAKALLPEFLNEWIESLKKPQGKYFEMN